MDEGYDVTVLRLAVSPVVEIFQTPRLRNETRVFWRICYDLCTTVVSRVLAGRGGTLWLVDLLLIDIFVLCFTRAIFQPQGCSQGTLWLGARGDVCLNGRGLKPVSGHPRHMDREQGSCVVSALQGPFADP